LSFGYPHHYASPITVLYRGIISTLLAAAANLFNQASAVLRVDQRNVLM
jgi:hypothetical protein